LESSSIPVAEILHPVEILTNLVYLAKHDVYDSSKVVEYLTMAELELERLVRTARKFSTRD
jgi:hypothetical protein